MLRSYVKAGFLAVLMLLSTGLFSQTTDSQVISVFPENRIQTFSVQLDNPAPFIAASLVWTTNGLAGHPKMRAQIADGSWTNWQELEPDGHNPFDAPQYGSQLVFLPAGAQQIQIDFEDPEASILNGDIYLFNPGKTGAPMGESAPAVETRECPCPQPDFEGRLDWCPNGDCPQDPTPEPTDVTHIIVHHSAGVNSSSDWAAVVRSIWNQHVNVNGWDDIGYNWLVDPNGVIYEGRGDGLQGAHFCGQNGNTVGICVLGNFQNTTPTNSALSGLRKFLAWETCDLGVDPTDFAFHEGSGLSLFYISGHRDGCSTACPGDDFYPMFPNLRQSVQDYIDNGCEEVAAPIDLTGTALNTTSVFLEWTPTSDAGTGYEIERSDETPTDFQWIGSVNSNTLDFTDNVDEGNYYYRVRGFGPQGDGNWSNVEFVSTIGAAVSDNWNPEFVLLSPMPFGESLQLQISDSYSGPIHMEILSLDGKLVKDLGSIDKSQHDLIQNWQLGELPAGMYFIRLKTDQQQLLLKTIKQ